jgi:hypothetical protein
LLFHSTRNGKKKLERSAGKGGCSAFSVLTHLLIEFFQIWKPSELSSGGGVDSVADSKQGRRYKKGGQAAHEFHDSKSVGKARDEGSTKRGFTGTETAASSPAKDCDGDSHTANPNKTKKYEPSDRARVVKVPVHHTRVHLFSLGDRSPS